jgi:type II secretory pathway component PulF
MVRVGEASGTLPLNLEYITEELKKKNELRKQIVGALLYPLIIVVATLGITIFLILYIFPKILPIFTSLHVALPLSTRILIGISEFLKSYWYVLFGLLALSIFIYPQLRKNEKFRYRTDSLLLKIPIFGRLCLYYNLSNTLRTLGLLVQHEVTIVEALAITGDSSDHLVYKKVLKEAQGGVIKGQLVSLQLRKYPSLFPPLCIQMIQSGEATGNLGTTLEYVSVMYEADMRDATKNLTTILEPLLMLTMGLCVGFIAVSIITPIYGITQNLHQ